MKKIKKSNHDPRMETPPGYYFEHTDWIPENNTPTSFFSMRDTIFFIFLVAACFLVATILWLKPPKIISFDATPEQTSKAVLSSQKVPKQLQKHPSFNQTQFEEISDDDPMIAGEDTELPLKEMEPETNFPHTLKSDLQRIIDFILASLHLPTLG